MRRSTGNARGSEATVARRHARVAYELVSFILLVLYFTLPALAGWVVRDWMPAILKTAIQHRPGHAGVAARCTGSRRRSSALCIGGWLADRWVERNDRGRIFVSAIGMAMIVPAIFGVGNAGTLYASPWHF